MQFRVSRLHGGGRAAVEPPESSSDIWDCFQVSIDLLAHVDTVGREEGCFLR